MKRLLALFLCLMMCVSLLPAAYAEDVEIIDIIDVDEPGEADGGALIAIVEPETSGGDEKLASKPVITTQPKSKTAYIDTTVKFTVKATGADSYRWQYRKDSSSGWTNSGLSSAKTATLSVKATAAKNGFQFRCKVTNSAGSVYSNTVTLTVSKKPVITTQPTSITAAKDTTVKFTVKATGATSYRWQYRTSSTGSWTNSGADGNWTATLSVKATEARNGYQYRCKLTNAEGTTYSKAAALTVVTKPSVTTQPLSYTASVGATVKFTVKASGGGLSYQWQYRKNSSSGWTDSSLSSAKSATLSVKTIEARDGYQFRCKVTNAAGSVYSGIGKLTTSTEQCGDNLHWTLSSKGLLTIGGTGKMYSFYNYDSFQLEPRPWTGLPTAVRTVTIKSGVTSIGDFALSDFSALTSVTIPDSVTSIEWAAFSDCIALTSVTIPDSVTKIGEAAFVECSALKSVTIPNSVTSIGDYAFCNCSALTSVTIPDSVTEIGYCAFSRCSALTSIKVSSGNEYYASKNGVLFSKDMTELIQYPGGKSGAYTIPDDVKSIGGAAFFDCRSLTSVTIPDSVTSIGYYAFEDCSALADVYYKGSKTQWKAISIADANDPLLNATRHYNA